MNFAKERVIPRPRLVVGVLDTQCVMSKISHHSIRNDAISLSKKFSGKNGSKLEQRSFDLQTMVSYYNFKLDKNLFHAAARTSLYGSDWIHKLLYTLLYFSSQQRNKFFYFFVALLLILTFHSLTLVLGGTIKLSP